MADPDHLAKIKEGVEVWNKWRDDNPEICPDLSEADFERANLMGADLVKANLIEADLSEANLRLTNLNEANLERADLSGVHLSGADLSKARFFLVNLESAHLENSNFESVYLSSIRFNKKTVCANTNINGCRINPLFKKHVEDGNYLFAFRQRYKAAYRIWWLVADCGDPVANALVDGDFTGDFSESFYDVATDGNGQAIITSSGCIKKPSYTFTVTDVTHDTLPYDSNDDVTDNCSD